jgi:hypothetical protein
VSLILLASFRSIRATLFERKNAVRNPMLIMRYPSPNRIQISVITLYNMNTVSLTRCWSFSPAERTKLYQTDTSPSSLQVPVVPCLSTWLAPRKMLFFLQVRISLSLWLSKLHIAPCP